MHKLHHVFYDLYSLPQLCNTVLYIVQCIELNFSQLFIILKRLRVYGVMAIYKCYYNLLLLLLLLLFIILLIIYITAQEGSNKM